jgi:predicted Rossmann fold flavoprotein
MNYDVVIIGAGAAGLMCASKTGQRGRRTLLIDHADKAGEKIRISGGGRCNFTNIHCGPDNFISQNLHFCKSALSRYSPFDFIDLVERYSIRWHEKTKGQLFCDGKSQEIIDMLLAECTQAGVDLWLGMGVKTITKSGEDFKVQTDHHRITAKSVVIATGGPSIPKMGASRFGYEIAAQFGLPLIEPVPALVPLTFTDQLKAPLKTLSGVSLEAAVSHHEAAFDEAVLFTHRGLSGPAILQISSYWKPGDFITLNMAPGYDIAAAMRRDKTTRPRISPSVWLSQFIPARLADYIAGHVKAVRLADLPDKAILNLALMVQNWRVKPAGSEGFRTAEVTKGGVDTAALSSKTMECKSVKGLYFIGEVVDVTGHLGGHNFQWAWASAAAAGDVC